MFINNKKIDLYNMSITNINSNNSLEMDLTKLSKNELLAKCQELGITKYKTKNKGVLIDLINSKSISSKKKFEFIIEDNDEEIIENTIIHNNIIQLFNTPQNHLKPLIKWSGGKSDEIKMFEKYFPENYNRYIEPFIGGGSVFFYLNPINAVISDVHVELIDFYRSIGEGKMQEIYEFMKNNPNDETIYYKIRDEMKINEPLDNAKVFYYQRKTCFRGMLRYNKHGKFNIPFGRYKTVNYDCLTNKQYEKLLSRTEILNEDFEYLFNNYNDENNFMFLDPPYDSEFTDYGYCQFGKEQQIKLAELFKITKIKCLMVIGKTKFIEELYSGYIVDEYDKKYKFKLYNNRVGDEINTKHLVIKNY